MPKPTLEVLEDRTAPSDFGALPPEINSAQLASLVASNLFGQNAPAIAATEAQYLEMWAQDAAAMFGVAAASFGAALAEGAAVGSPGVLSGNVIQVPIHIPINVCGSPLDTAFGNSCMG